LMHALERAVVLAEDSIIDAEDIDLSMHAQRPVVAIHPSTFPASDIQNDDHITLRLPIREASIAETEKHLVRELLRHVQGNKSRAAAMLQISRPRLERILKQDREFFKSVLK
jgi:DNA-binding NtrC family response regulator